MALATALPGEVTLCEAQTIALARYVSECGSSLSEDSAFFWALPDVADVDSEGCITPIGEVRLMLHARLQQSMTSFGVNMALGWHHNISEIALPLSIALSLAHMLAVERGVHNP